MAGAVSSSIHSFRVPEASRKPLEFSELSNEIRKAVFVSSCGTKNETEASIYQSFFYQSLCLSWSLSTLTSFYQAYMSAFRLTIPIIGASIYCWIRKQWMFSPRIMPRQRFAECFVLWTQIFLFLSVYLFRSVFKNIRTRKSMYFKDEDRSLVVA